MDNLSSHEQFCGSRWSQLDDEHGTHCTLVFPLLQPELDCHQGLVPLRRLLDSSANDDPGHDNVCIYRDPDKHLKGGHIQSR